MKRLMLLFTFTVIGLMLTVNASAKTIVTDGLVSYWTFDRTTINNRTVEDVWGENDATIVGNPKVVRGYLKQGLALDGVGDYVSLPIGVNLRGKSIWQCLQSRRDDMFIAKRSTLLFSPVGTICPFFYVVPTELKRGDTFFL